jgi:HSP20 family protein
MSTLDQMRDGLHRAWDNVADGWRQLSERASSALTRFNPVRHADQLQTADEQLVAHASRWGLLAAEVTETDKEVVVRLEVPGMERDDFDLDVVDGRYLVVRGEKRAERQEQRGRYYVMERAYGSFERAIPLPAMVEEGGTSARYRRGVLQVTLPKAAAARARRINVEG